MASDPSEPSEPFDIRDRPEFKVSHSTAEGIGRIVAYWSMLDDFVGFIIQKILELDFHIGTIVVAELSSFDRVTLLTSLIHHTKNKTWFSDWCELADKINSLRDQRNDVVHGLWDENEKIAILRRKKSRGKLDLRATAISQQKLADDCESVLDCINELISFGSKIDREGIGSAIRNPPDGPSLDRRQSPAALDLQASRDRKKANRATQAAKARSGSQPKARFDKPHARKPSN